jgi:hypothetical protein
MELFSQRLILHGAAKTLSSTMITASRAGPAENPKGQWMRSARQFELISPQPPSRSLALAQR